MTTYHLEYRSPSEGESYLPASLVASGSAILHVAHDDFERPGYVFTEDRPRGERPTADVIRITGIDHDYLSGSVIPIIAIRQHAIGATWYHTTTGFSIDPKRITAWDDIVPVAPPEEDR